MIILFIAIAHMFAQCIYMVVLIINVGLRGITKRVFHSLQRIHFLSEVRTWHFRHFGIDTANGTYRNIDYIGHCIEN